MSEQFTPTSFQVREDYAHLRYHFADGWSIGEERVQFDRWLDQVKADVWDEGAETAWKATGDGHNGEYAHPFGTPDGSVPFREANPDTPNPYRKQEEA